ncbi:phenylalanine--tRNA ligase subunit beta [Arsenophonus nasoniae]|uniref:Phenylalanine--tRNA ligase beta subunit n=1 Tax=Arsenophonus nasoniae TaxID=638 RepID=D2TVW8_9GAMM|nr:phenylalanine--tRNA ligase subunit beta [Arsenophonus nasoniae]QBY43082.1 Phenylalanine--tRNA ligase beta subunit [Arsenophonus nasoniae]WGM07114.1 phenylalanine--tRNA ligase subunit beta [Arsenophonus nasoniae]WGM11993.1 phenylalanine--tRNA ligase subunit beta [Arsenophonus nasoniae]WGM16677.1 phenylalanine--tRNA ligase subunit beta [Arsenophonus nasoniae]CBA71498.1 phenylalanyl-tRNA synthetase beta chain [Arsenophonus nasoniae]
MKLSEFWLREWVNPAISSEALSEQMTMAGLEIDDVKPVAGQFQGVLVGEIVECVQHPNADKLRLTKVNIGAEQLLNIVCGAPNCRQGLKVAVATIGAVLPDNFKIKATKLRGELSEGMLCSYSELAIVNDHAGIIELPHDAPIGIDIRNYLQLDDHIFEVSLTPNRADCLSILGIARDIAAINNLALNTKKIEPVKGTDASVFPIRVEAPMACPRFLGRVIKGIDITASTPIWMKEKLRRGGIRAIDPVVDITNFVLLELGQPLHAYDLDRLNGAIIVRMAKQDETLVLLDDSEVTMKQDTLVIADEKGALGIAGIFGGKHSSVNQNTTNILLESAFFDPLTIAGRARNYGLHTEASHRFERGVDPQLQYKAMERATQLILEICGGDAGNIIDVSHQTSLPKGAKITLTRLKLDRLIGHSIPDINVTQILERLGCQVIGKQDSWQVVAPSWRFDMQIEEDLIEEVARVYGYNNIPNVPLRADLVMTPRCESVLPLKRVKTLLIDRGYNEAITYSFVDPKIQQLLHPDSDAMILPDPISTDMSAMRLSLLPGLLMTVIYNQNRQQNRIRLFETGLRFLPDPSAEHGIRQELMLAGVITGNRYEEHWLQEKRAVDFFDIKGDVEAILELTGKLDNIIYKAHSNPALHPGQSAGIYLNNNYIGYVGVIHPELENKLDLNGRTLVFELLWDTVAERVIPKANMISRFPANRRDIAVVVPEEVATADVLAECKKIGINHIVGINLFDVYCGKGVAEGYKSLAISLILQDTNRTLEEEEIAATVDKCVAALKRRFQASLRD